MRTELLVATKNIKKLKEIKEILRGLPFRISSLADHHQGIRIVENAKTFKGNAVKKAVKVARATGKLTMGEDSGLCINILGGKPGVFSARFSGKEKSDAKNNELVLKLLSGVPRAKRGAHYACAVAIADSRGLVSVVEGRCSGRIGTELKGAAGFGYDPLFIIPKYNKTFAQLGAKIKHKMSHRYRALEKAKRVLLGNRLRKA